MKLKKYLGCFILMLTSVMINSGTASLLTIGVEEIPDSMKGLR
ncbi:hypothetical protein [Clostridium celatum]|uniref:Cyclic lactone autoinducer peptide n=1 Tax=Clostridium celatum DSM 1785 TaxID=545697 RepID=L1Q6V0_9CLOT|nr:hypothetical protein [Clostridium celatum]EKY23312.1 hypothetical protein HMPREF0216_02982 [Clostridium celatum DSM 1785]MDU3723525.1 hypothetical protein [Clostridium celatum]MDU6296083.1 hypothetical protein [Clostridium celatum]MDY3361742.1 hypothetical protein [Clostridium celatum]